MIDRTRLEDVRRFYEILGKLERKVGKPKILANYSRCSLKRCWSTGGVYFFMENGEKRSESGEDLRVVRIGLSRKLWRRLYGHKSRSSSFRTDVVRALINKHEINYSYYTKWKNRKSSILKNDPTIKKFIVHDKK